MQKSEKIVLRQSETQDLEMVQQFLQKLNLPITGVEEQFENFFLLFDNSILIGCAGVEVYGPYGLIRSVAIEHAYQGKKFGSTIVNKIELVAKNKKLNGLYLLTETAERFFTKLGYKIVLRDNVPQEIQNSLEYSSACKVSALVMKKDFW